MSLIVYYVAFASLAFVADMWVAGYPDELPLQYLDKLKDATKKHRENIEFLQQLVEVDYLWWPILNEKVKIKVPKVFDPYAGPSDPETQQYDELITRPFVIIADLFKTKTFTGRDVRIAIDAFKSAMVCSVLKRVSMQALMFHALTFKYDEHIVPDVEVTLFRKWLKNMVQLALDKLITMNQSHDQQQPITRAYVLLAEMLRKLLENTNPKFKTRDLPEISTDMYIEIENTCVVPKDQRGQYSALVANFNKDKMVEELKRHRTRITEPLQEAIKLHRIEAMRYSDGDISIDDGIKKDGIFELTQDTLRRATAANYFQMNFLFLNLPVQTLRKSQMETIFKEIIEDSQPK